MSIIQTLKQLIGYTSNDLDIIFIAFSLAICFYFLDTLFNILFALFRGH